MIRVRWELEEAVVLLDAYLKNGSTLSVPEEKLSRLTALYQERARQLGYTVDEKFRNKAGLNMQLAGLHYVVTDGAEGLSNVSKIFYKAYDLYRDDPERFQKIKDEFYRKYDV